MVSGSLWQRACNHIRANVARVMAYNLQIFKNPARTHALHAALP